jgi:hypothetical protein
MFSAAALARVVTSSDRALHDTSSSRHRAPVRSDRTYFVLGQNSAGRWVARDQGNRRGGVFVSQSAALTYIRREVDPRGQFVVVYLPGGLELNLK